MRLPGTRYQEPGWEGVRKLLGHASLVAFRQCDLALLFDPARRGEMLDWYTDALAHAVRHASGSLRGAAPGNSYGDTIGDLALGLLFELQAQPAYFAAFASAIDAEHEKSGPFWLHSSGDALLRKKVNDMFATLRDKVDADNYVAATGQPCTPNRIYTYRMLDMAYAAIAQVFAGWPGTALQVAAILDREAQGIPIEVRQMKSIATCRPEWVISWSETLERFEGAPGPLHTKSKRFASLRNNPGTVKAMLAEIGDYEELSANLDGASWRHDVHDAAAWLEDLDRVVAGATGEGPDRIVPAPDDEDDEVCGSPRYAEVPGQQAALAALNDAALPVRQAVFLKLLGPADDSYPDEWLEEDTGELPPLQRLAQRAGMSVPTLRKRRNAAIDRLYGLAGARPTGENDEH